MRLFPLCFGLSTETCRQPLLMSLLILPLHVSSRSNLIRHHRDSLDNPFSLAFALYLATISDSPRAIFFTDDFSMLSRIISLELEESRLVYMICCREISFTAIPQYHYPY